MASARLADSSLARGRVVARVLAGSWRPTPPPLDLAVAELAVVAPVLHRAGCSGLAWRRLEGTPLREAPGAALLHDGFVHHTLKVRLLERHLPTLVARLRDRGVETILGKGWAVGHRYPMVGMRPYGDLDLLVRASDLGDARQVVAEWEGTPPFVEFHTGFNELRDRDVSDLFRRSRLEDFGGTPIRVFAPEDHLRLLALHALEHGLARPFWLCDVALLLETLPDGFDWVSFTGGGRWESQGVRCVLGLVGELLGVDLERVEVPARWRAPRLPPWLVPAALKALGASEHYADAGHPSDHLLAPRALLRAARLRWANPIEVSFRRRVPWNGLPRLPFQVADYLIRGLGFAAGAPGDAWRMVRQGGSGG